MKKLVDKLIEECNENIDEVKIASENNHKNKQFLHTVQCCFQ